MEEPEHITEFRSWFQANGGAIHPNVSYQKVGSGFSIFARELISEDEDIVSCPFSLVITPDLSRRALLGLLRVDADQEDSFKNLSETQLMCTYICMHWIIDNENSTSAGFLKHLPYLKTLPASSQLFTPLHFSEAELSLFEGSNIFSATLDRKHTWQQQHEACAAVIAKVYPAWGAEFTWERYLTAATYISSRAFPSTLLSPTPSLVATPESYPILLPGVDALNHARAKPVSWLVSHPSGQPSSEAGSKVYLVVHTRTPAGLEVFNNYGPKPNAELILGYGFTLENNPDDTIVLKIGGSLGGSQLRWEVGRQAKGIEPVWEVILAAVHEEDEDEEEQEEGVVIVSVEEELYASEMLEQMAAGLKDKLPSVPANLPQYVRPEVLGMLLHYIEGQHDILRSIILFAQEKKNSALRWAEENDLSIVAEQEEEEEEE